MDYKHSRKEDNSPHASQFSAIYPGKLRALAMLMNKSKTKSSVRPLTVFTLERDAEDGYFKAELEEDTVLKALRTSLITGLLLGIMPLYGILHDSPKKLHFRWFSLRTAASILMLLGSSFFLISIITYGGINSSSVGAVVFYSVSCVGIILFIQLAQNWRDVEIHWAEVNKFMGFREEKIIKRLKLITISMIVISLAEHCLANANAYFKIANKRGHGFKTYMIYKFYYIFLNTLEYSSIKGAVIFILNLQATLVWNFIDIFIINIATSLAEVFKFYDNGINIAVTKDRSIAFWKKKREEYCEMGILVQSIDQKLSKLVILSFGTNFFFICMQLYHSLINNNTTIRNIYFLGSFGYLAARMSIVCLSAAEIYDYSKKPLDKLFTISSEQFNIEIERLQDAITAETIALSGYDFFILNRKLILTILGTIASYEFVLVQFNSFND